MLHSGADHHAHVVSGFDGPAPLVESLARAPCGPIGRGSRLPVELRVVWARTLDSGAAPPRARVSIWHVRPLIRNMPNRLASRMDSSGSESPSSRDDHDWPPPPSFLTVGCHPNRGNLGGVHAVLSSLLFCCWCTPYFLLYLKKLGIPFSWCDRGWEKGGELHVPSPG